MIIKVLHECSVIKTIVRSSEIWYYCCCLQSCRSAELRLLLSHTSADCSDNYFVHSCVGKAASSRDKASAVGWLPQCCIGSHCHKIGPWTFSLFSLHPDKLLCLLGWSRLQFLQNSLNVFFSSILLHISFSVSLFPVWQLLLSWLLSWKDKTSGHTELTWKKWSFATRKSFIFVDEGSFCVWAITAFVQRHLADSGQSSRKRERPNPSANIFNHPCLPPNVKQLLIFLLLRLRNER